jgi:hypothetical protein
MFAELRMEEMDKFEIQGISSTLSSKTPGAWVSVIKR